MRECVPPFKSSGFSDSISYSNYYLIAKKHGLCADHLACAFVDCAWSDAAVATLEAANVSAVSYDSIKVNLPALNLPSTVAFPQNVKQLVKAVNSARSRKSGLISVKTSGHSYHGSSTMRDSTLINLRSLTKYAATGIVECSGASTGACVLALARGKKAIIRVGGGEAHDDTYRAVLEWNNKHANKYTVVGGGAGTVSAAGGWLQGGGLSTGLERHYGFGVDQILEIEMVLADGTHVKFGPTQWTQDGDYLYPKTTAVGGLCNSNLVYDESLWNWTPCLKSIPFDDLWFAVRGGGGGTYGIVTAVQVQLHDFLSVYIIWVDSTALGSVVSYCNSNDCTEVENLLYDFFVDFFWNPVALGLSADTSNLCGSPGITFSVSGNIFGGTFTSFMCEGVAARDAFISAWQNYVTTVYLPSYPGLPSDGMNNLFNSGEIGSYAALSLQTTSGGIVPVGHIQDNPPPETQSLSGLPLWSALVPIEWLKQKNDEVRNFLQNVANSCHLIGGVTDKAHDQTTSVNPFQRTSGLQCVIINEYNSFPYEQHYRTQFLPYMATAAGKFPGGAEYNHIAPNQVGPLKSNWTIPCPQTYTKAEQAVNCVSLQESVWGTDILARLETTKLLVDPLSNFNCHFCVGEKYVAAL